MADHLPSTHKLTAQPPTGFSDPSLLSPQVPITAVCPASGLFLSHDCLPGCPQEYVPSPLEISENTRTKHSTHSSVPHVSPCKNLPVVSVRAAIMEQEQNTAMECSQRGSRLTREQTSAAAWAPAHTQADLGGSVGPGSHVSRP